MTTELLTTFSGEKNKIWKMFLLNWCNTLSVGLTKSRTWSKSPFIKRLMMPMISHSNSLYGHSKLQNKDNQEPKKVLNTPWCCQDRYDRCDGVTEGLNESCPVIIIREPIFAVVIILEQVQKKPENLWRTDIVRSSQARHCNRDDLQE